jgi:NAD(P)-dependent dehydrogenase (short-subunit alcohol dehydrogenase family)
MTAHKPIIAVTGANRGIGFEICRQLAGRGALVILTARSPEAGEAAANKLNGQNLPVQFHPLDPTKEESIATFAATLDSRYGRVDVLINNAGIFAKDDGNALDVTLDTVRTTLETNTLAPLRLSQALVPLLKRSQTARIVNISSGMGQLSEMGGGSVAYRISKTALNAVTGVLAAELRGEVAVNAMCPGWVKSDMGGKEATRELPEGAAGAVWLALDAPQDFTGHFTRDGNIIPW